MSEPKNAREVTRKILDECVSVNLSKGYVETRYEQAVEILDAYTSSLRAERDALKEQQVIDDRTEFGLSQTICHLENQVGQLTAERDAALEREAGFKQVALAQIDGWANRGYNGHDIYESFAAIPTAASDAQVAVMKLEARLQEAERCRRLAVENTEPINHLLFLAFKGHIAALESDLNAAIARRDEIVRGK